MTTTSQSRNIQPSRPASLFLQAVNDAIRPVEDEDGMTLFYLVSTAGEPLPAKQAGSKLAKATSAYANTGGFLDLPGLYYVLLADCSLPASVAEEVASRAGRAGTLALAHNPYLSEELWAKVYLATAGVGRHALVTRRLLTRAQRELVLSAREKSPFVLPEVAGQLNEDDLRRLADTARGRALDTLEAELERRVQGATAVQRPDGSGAVMLRSKVAGGWAVGNGTYRLPEDVLESSVVGYTGANLALAVMSGDRCDSYALTALLVERLGDGSTSESIEAWVTCAEMSAAWHGTIGELLDAVEGVLHTS